MLTTGTSNVGNADGVRGRVRIPGGITVPANASRARWALAAVIVLGVGAPLLVAIATGNVSIPHNDAWAYSRIAESFGRGDGFALVGWNRLGLFGQVVPLGPLGHWITAQTLTVAIAAAIGLILTYDLVARASRRSFGVIAAAIVALFPGFGLLSTSFMADVPAFTLTVGCLTIGRRAFDRHSLPLLTAAVAVGVWGATVREQAIAAPASLILAALVIWPSPRRRLTIVGVGVAVAAVFIGFEAWRHGLAHDTPAPTHYTIGRLRLLAVETFCTLALLVSPAVMLVTRPRSWSWPARVTALATAGWIVIGVLRHDGSITLPNYLDLHGAYTGAFTGSPRVLPDGVWFASRALAVVSAVLLGGEIVARFRACRIEIQVFLLAVAIGTAYELVAGQDVFDRYLLAPVAAVLVLLFTPNERAAPAVSFTRPGARLAISAAVLLAAIGGAITLNGLARDAARWDAAERLQRTRLDPMSIDAGLEWLGWHSAAGVGDAGTYVRDPSASWYAQMFPDARRCVLVAASPQSSGVLVGRFGYRTYALFGQSYLYIYAVGTC